MATLDHELVFHIVRVMGLGIYVTNCTLLSWQIVSSNSVRFFLINTIAAILLLASNFIDFNIASVMIQVFWIAIGTKAVLIRRRMSCFTGSTKGTA